jgi:hypothetical protein
LGTFAIAPTPEPGSLSLMSLALLVGFWLITQRRIRPVPAASPMLSPD